MRIAITHTTRYRYDVASRLIQALRLRPVGTRAQRVLDWQVQVVGAQAGLHYVDAFANRVDLVVAPRPVTEVEITAGGVIETTDTAGVAGNTGEAVVPAVFLRETPLTAADPAIAAFARDCARPDRLATLHALLDGLHARVAYRPGTTESTTSAAAAFAAENGVCQDHTHIFVAAARSLAIPARYVTGYLLIDETHAVAHHAWAEALAPELGWVGFDAANGQCPTERYVRLACGLDAAGAAPVRGIRHGMASERLDVKVAAAEQRQQ